MVFGGGTQEYRQCRLQSFAACGGLGAQVAKIA